MRRPTCFDVYPAPSEKHRNDLKFRKIKSNLGILDAFFLSLWSDPLRIKTHFGITLGGFMFTIYVESHVTRYFYRSLSIMWKNPRVKSRSWNIFTSFNFFYVSLESIFTVVFLSFLWNFPSMIFWKTNWVMLTLILCQVENDTFRIKTIRGAKHNYYSKVHGYFRKLKIFHKNK